MKRRCNCCGIEKNESKFSKYYGKRSYHTLRKICDKCRYEKYYKNKKYGKRFKWKEATESEKIDRMRKNFGKKSKQVGECLIWTGFVDYDGYGKTVYDGKNMRCNRIAWIINHGPIPVGMLVCHHCDVRNCIFTGHLFLGTPKDNTQDMIKKGRRVTLRGAQCHFAKLTESQARKIKIRALNDESMTKIAYEFGVEHGTVADIKRGKNWKHVKV